METTRLSSKGQVVIPKAIRDRLRLLAGTELKISHAGSRIIMEPVSVKSRKLSEWRGFRRRVNSLSDKEAFAPVDITNSD